MSGPIPPASGPIPPAGSPAGSSPPNDAQERVAQAGADAQAKVEELGDEAEAKVHVAQARAKAKIAETEAKVKAKVADAEATVRRQVDEVQRTVGELKGLSDPTPARSVDEAVSQAGDLRRAIDRDLDTLQARVPPGEELAQKAKTVGGAVLGAVGVVAAIAIAGKQRGDRKRVEREARAHAAAIARYLPGASARPAPEADDGGGGSKGKLALLALVGAGVAAYLVSRSSGGDEESDLWGPAT